MKILTERGYAFTTAADREIGRDAKEKLCYIALDFDTEMKEASESSDKEKNERIGTASSPLEVTLSYPEILFQPNFTDKEAITEDLQASRGQHHHR